MKGPIRDGDKWGDGEQKNRSGDRRVKQKSETSKQAPTQKIKAAVDRCQNNRMLRQCPSSIAQQPQCHAIAVPTAMQNSHKDNVRSSAVGKSCRDCINYSVHTVPRVILKASFGKLAC